MKNKKMGQAARMGALAAAAGGAGAMLDRFDAFGITTTSFVFMIDGRPVGSFQSLSGMSVTVDEFTIEEGGNNHSVIKRPGRMTWPNLTLRRGISMADTLWDWINATSGEGFAADQNSAGGAAGKLNAAKTAAGMGTQVGKNMFDAQTGALILMTPFMVPLRAWWVYEALPVSWTGPDFSAESSSEGVPMEELVIAHQGLKRQDMPV